MKWLLAVWKCFGLCLPGRLIHFFLTSFSTYTSVRKMVCTKTAVKVEQSKGNVWFLPSSLQRFHLAKTFLLPNILHSIFTLILLRNKHQTFQLSLDDLFLYQCLTRLSRKLQTSHYTFLIFSAFFTHCLEFWDIIVKKLHSSENNSIWQWKSIVHRMWDSGYVRLRFFVLHVFLYFFVYFALFWRSTFTCVRMVIICWARNLSFYFSHVHYIWRC